MELPIVMCSILKQCWSVGYVSMLTLSLIFNNAKQNIFKEKFQLVLNTLIYYSKVGLRQFKGGFRDVKNEERLQMDRQNRREIQRNIL